MTVQEKIDSHKGQDRLHLLSIKYKEKLTQGFQILLKIVVADHFPVTIEIRRHSCLGDCQNQRQCVDSAPHSSLPFFVVSLNSSFLYLFFSPCSYASPSNPIIVGSVAFKSFHKAEPLRFLTTAGWLDLNRMKHSPSMQLL